ncbi:uncharacterized protein [Miscanthus floridulus]|uniref:uncharacterized protein n=1 Tax=Miscanthus floridulus TaxID=154761 RepID=UPI003457D2CB
MRALGVASTYSRFGVGNDCPLRGPLIIVYRFDHRKRYKTKDWRITHSSSTRTHIKPPYTNVAIDEDSEEDVIEDVYDVTTREDTQLQRAPLQRYVATQLGRLSNEAAFRLHESRGQGPGVLAAFVEKVKKSCRKLAQKLSCMDTPYEEPSLPA